MAIKEEKKKKRWELGGERGKKNRRIAERNPKNWEGGRCLELVNLKGTEKLRQVKHRGAVTNRPVTVPASSCAQRGGEARGPPRRDPTRGSHSAEHQGQGPSPSPVASRLPLQRDAPEQQLSSAARHQEGGPSAEERSEGRRGATFRAWLPPPMPSGAPRQPGPTICRSRDGLSTANAPPACALKEKVPNDFVIQNLRTSTLLSLIPLSPAHLL